MPERRPLRAIPVPAGMDPEQRIKLAEEAGTRERDLQARLAEVEQERDRLAAEVGRWVALPWWRRLFA